MNLQPTHLRNGSVWLEPLKESQFEILFAVAADPLVWEQHPNPDRYKREVFEIFFQGAIASGGAFLIRDVADDRVIGSSRYYDFSMEQGEVKIGYTFFSRDCWGKGFNEAAKSLMLDYAFQHVNRVLFEVGENNIRSQKAMAKIGAVKVGEKDVAYYGEPPKRNYIYQISGRKES